MRKILLPLVVAFSIITLLPSNTLVSNAPIKSPAYTTLGHGMEG